MRSHENRNSFPGIASYSHKQRNDSIDKGQNSGHDIHKQTGGSLLPAKAWSL